MLACWSCDVWWIFLYVCITNSANNVILWSNGYNYTGSTTTLAHCVKVLSLREFPTVAPLSTAQSAIASKRRSRRIYKFSECQTQWSVHQSNNATLYKEPSYKKGGLMEQLKRKGFSMEASCRYARAQSARRIANDNGKWLWHVCS